MAKDVVDGAPGMIRIDGELVEAREETTAAAKVANGAKAAVGSTEADTRTPVGEANGRRERGGLENASRVCSLASACACL